MEPELSNAAFEFGSKEPRQNFAAAICNCHDKLTWHIFAF